MADITVTKECVTAICTEEDLRNAREDLLKQPEGKSGMISGQAPYVCLGDAVYLNPIELSFWKRILYFLLRKPCNKIIPINPSVAPDTNRVIGLCLDDGKSGDEVRVKIQIP